MSFKESVLIPMSDYKKLLTFKRQQKNYSDILHDNDMPVNVKMMLYDQEQHFKPTKIMKKYEKNDNIYYEYLTSLPPYFIDLGMKLLDFLEQKQKNGSISFQESANGLIVNDHVLPKLSFKRLIEVLFSTKDITKKDESTFISIFYKILLRLGYDSHEIPATEWLLKNRADVKENLRIPSFIPNNVIKRKSNDKSLPFDLLENNNKTKIYKNEIKQNMTQNEEQNESRINKNRIKQNMLQDEEQNEMFFDAFSNTPERKINENKANVPLIRKTTTIKSSDTEEEASEEESNSELQEKDTELDKKKKIKRPNPREPKYPSNFETRSHRKQTGSGFRKNQPIKWMIY